MFRKPLILLIFLFFSCSNSNNNQSKKTADNTQENVSVNITNSIGDVLSPEARKLVENWMEYDAVEKIINEYYNISVTKAISNAEELSNATQLLKDSIRVERFKQPDLKMRLNVLNSIALRLSDLEKIPQKSEEEIKTEVDNLINIFTSITIKLNNITNQEVLEKDLINIENLKN